MKQVQPVTEDEILRQLQNGDEKALKQVYKQHYQMVVHLVMNNGGSLQEAKDVYQEALILFYEKVREDSFELNCRIKTFLYSVGRRMWLKQLQRKNRFTSNLSDTEEYIEVPWRRWGKRRSNSTRCIRHSNHWVNPAGRFSRISTCIIKVWRKLQRSSVIRMLIMQRIKSTNA